MVTPQWGTFQKPNQMEVEEELGQQEELQQEIPGKIQDENKPEQEKPKWGNFSSPETYQGEVDPDAEEGMFDFITRVALDNTARFIEKFGGALGDTEKFAKDTLANIPSKGGYIADAISSLIGKERWERIVRGRPGAEQRFPTSKQIKGQSELILGRSTEPKSKQEKGLQELSGDIGSVAGGTAMFGGIPSIQNLLTIPAAANAVKETVEWAGLGEDTAQKAKAAVWLPLTLAGNVNGPQYASQLMNAGRKGIPSTVQMDVPRFSQALDSVEKTLLTADPRTALARQTISGLRNDLAMGQTNAQSAMTMYDAVNAAKRNRGMFELGKSDQAFAKKSIDQVRNVVRDEIKQIGAPYPEALKSWQDGVTAWSVIHKSNSITNYVKDVAQGPYAKILTGPAAALFGVGSFGGFKSPLVAGAASASIPSLYKTGQILYRASQDPRLAKYYWGAISAASAENTPAFISNYEKLNNELQKSVSAKEKHKSTKN
jgi:hypothetical protein